MKKCEGFSISIHNFDQETLKYLGVILEFKNKLSYFVFKFCEDFKKEDCDRLKEAYSGKLFKVFRDNEI